MKRHKSGYYGILQNQSIPTIDHVGPGVRCITIKGRTVWYLAVEVFENGEWVETWNRTVMLQC